jgi:hypothetical protein
MILIYKKNSCEKKRKEGRGVKGGGREKKGRL